MAFLYIDSLFTLFLLGFSPFILLFLVECEHYISSTIFSLTLVFVLGFCIKDWSWVTFLLEHPITSVLYVLGYFGAGVLWGFAKWFSFLRTWADKYKKFMASDSRNKSLDVFISGTFRMNYSGPFPPTASAFSVQIINWIAYWPLSALWTLLNDPLRRFASWVYRNLFAGTYQRIANYVFKDIKFDVVTK